MVVCSVKFDIQPGREGIVDFESGQETNDLQSKEWPSDGGEYETERLCGHSILKLTNMFCKLLVNSRLRHEHFSYIYSGINSKSCPMIKHWTGSLALIKVTDWENNLILQGLRHLGTYIINEKGLTYYQNSKTISQSLHINWNLNKWFILGRKSQRNYGCSTLSKTSPVIKLHITYMGSVVITVLGLICKIWFIIWDIFTTFCRDKQYG